MGCRVAFLPSDIYTSLDYTFPAPDPASALRWIAVLRGGATKFGEASARLSLFSREHVSLLFAFEKREKICERQNTCARYDNIAVAPINGLRAANVMKYLRNIDDKYERSAMRRRETRICKAAPIALEVCLIGRETDNQAASR